MSVNGMLADLLGRAPRARPRDNAKFRLRKVVSYVQLPGGVTRYVLSCKHVVEVARDVGQRTRCHTCE